MKIRHARFTDHGHLWRTGHRPGHVFLHVGRHTWSLTWGF